MQVELTKDDIFLPSYRGRLTEGITYNKANNTVLWVDIILAEVHRVFLDDMRHQVLKLDTQGDSIGTIGLTEDPDVIILAQKEGVSKGSFTTGEITSMLKYPKDVRVRSNDGKIDPYGNLIVGTMKDFTETLQPIGTLYQVTPDLKLNTLRTNCLIPNGLGFTSNHEFYWTDSPRHTMYKFQYDAEQGELKDEEVFIKTTESFSEEVEPDGMCISNQDNFFIGLFNGSAVIKLNTTGQQVGKFKMPAKRITCCTIGGIDGDELFITTAHADHEDLNAPIENDKTGDLGGFIFRVKLTDPEPEIQYIWGLKNQK